MPLDLIICNTSKYEVGVAGEVLIILKLNNNMGEDPWILKYK